MVVSRNVLVFILKNKCYLYYMIDDVSEIIRDCAHKLILPRFKNLETNDVQSKTSPRDLVTIADIEAEYYLQEQIPKAVSNAFVVGEESVSRGEHKLRDLEKHGSDPVFIVDPVDGTNNFVRGSEVFGVMVAMLIDGECHKAWIYDPCKDAMTTASKGEGAFTNGQRISVSSNTDVEKTSGYASLRYMKKDMRNHFISHGSSVNLLDSISCAAHMYLDVAHGRKDFTIFTRLKPWDHLPGVLICQEAGGFAVDWHEQPYTVYTQDAGIITANSESTWRALHNMLISTL